MIILVVGDFGVGKDTFADMLLKYFGEDANKIRSYTTREPRYEGEDTHLFITKEEWLDFPNVIAQTQINDEFYGTIVEQFGTKKYDIYVVDDIGVRDVVEANIDDVFIVEIIRPKWLINLSEDRLNRKRTDSFFYSPDYHIINDGSLEKLDSYAREVYNWLMVHT